jgi:hypothetical protein
MKEMLLAESARVVPSTVSARKFLLYICVYQRGSNDQQQVLWPISSASTNCICTLNCDAFFFFASGWGTGGRRKVRDLPLLENDTKHRKHFLRARYYCLFFSFFLGQCHVLCNLISLHIVRELRHAKQREESQIS